MASIHSGFDIVAEVLLWPVGLKSSIWNVPGIIQFAHMSNMYWHHT